MLENAKEGRALNVDTKQQMCGMTTSTVREKTRLFPSASVKVDPRRLAMPKSSGAPCKTLLTVARALVALVMLRP